MDVVLPHAVDAQVAARQPFGTVAAFFQHPQGSCVAGHHIRLHPVQRGRAEGEARAGLHGLRHIAAAAQRAVQLIAQKARLERSAHDIVQRNAADDAPGDVFQRKIKAHARALRRALHIGGKLPRVMLRRIKARGPLGLERCQKRRVAKVIVQHGWGQPGRGGQQNKAARFQRGGDKLHNKPPVHCKNDAPQLVEKALLFRQAAARFVFKKISSLSRWVP